MHILLIDDSSSTRSLLRTLINSGQTVRHEVSEAASGEESLQKVESGQISMPDLIIMDINMGGMNGYELCREFRQRYGTNSDFVPYIIVVTANEGVDVINMALDSGANDYMPKPVNVKVLQIRLRVAERLVALSQSGYIGVRRDVANVPTPVASGGESSAEPPSLIMDAIENTDAPIALIETIGHDPSFRIIYTNLALSETTQFDRTQLVGKSLAELEAWTPEFLKMVLGYVRRTASLSHVPLWSNTRQAVPVHLSFYPVRSLEDVVNHYIVIHHF